MDGKEDTKFPVGKSGNKLGRPKGSRNKITLMKLMAEEAVRGDNAADIQKVCALVISQALNGDAASQKLVWASAISNGTSEQTAAAEKVSINIGTFEPQEKAIEAEVTIIPNEETENEQTIQ